MKHFWKASSSDVDADRAHSDRWTCQLVYAEFEGSSAIFDFVALEPGPVWGSGCSRFTPFTVDVELPDAEQAALLRDWTEVADVVTITTGFHGGSHWLCMSARDEHVVVAFIDRPGDTTGG